MWSLRFFGGVSLPLISATHWYYKSSQMVKCDNTMDTNLLSISGLPIKSSYDYIIIGSGAGGSAVAGQLALLSSSSVLLIEEGMDSTSMSSVNDASKVMDVLSDPDIKKGYCTVPQLGLNNRFQPQWKAKITGGCSSHNGMLWSFGSRNDFDKKWNINGWKWNNIEPYWNKINKNDFDISIYKDDGYKNILLNAAKEVGYKYNNDYNDLSASNGPNGVSFVQHNCKQISSELCQRQTSWTQYVLPVLNTKDNLDVMTNTTAVKLLFEENNTNSFWNKLFQKNKKPKANGIKIKTETKDGEYQYNDIKCNKEIILSCGSFDTVKLLLLSGIGDKDTLENKHNIKCISNVPAVGKHLEDHPCSIMISPKLKNITADKYPKKQRSACEGLFIVTDDDEYEHVVEVVTTDTGPFWGYGSFENENEVHILVFSQVEHYTGTGTVEIALDDPENSPPVINPNILSNKIDENKIITIFKQAREIMYSNELKKLYDGDEKNEYFPGYHIKTNDDKQILEWARNNIFATAHPCSTCKMGNNFTNENLDNIVVDNRLRVRGVDNLRIADSSIMPTIITGHPNAITMLIGVKAADLILEDNGGTPCIKY